MWVVEFGEEYSVQGARPTSCQNIRAVSYAAYLKGSTVCGHKGPVCCWGRARLPTTMWTQSLTEYNNRTTRFPQAAQHHTPNKAKFQLYKREQEKKSKSSVYILKYRNPQKAE